jgi:hypothetical protein
MKRVFIEYGGPTRKIQIEGKIYTFEDHPYCGPSLLDKKGDPLSKQPMKFLHAASLWKQQGGKIKDGLCEWYHDPEPMLVHLGGKNYKVIGYKKPKKGT